MMVIIKKGTVNMKMYFTSIRIIIVLSMIVSVSFGADQLDEVITEEQNNIVYRNSVDFNNVSFSSLIIVPSSSFFFNRLYSDKRNFI